MMRDQARFWAELRERLGKRFTQKQVDGINAILQAGAHLDAAPLAYVLATSAWETGMKFQPVEEIGRGKGRAYGRPAGPYGHIYYGRGDVQLTWLRNYQLASKKLGIDLVRFPERALENEISKRILIAGMSEGWFTSRKLDHYFSATKADFVGARAIVNGSDRAEKIAAIAEKVHAALKAGGWAEAPQPAIPAQPVPTPKEPTMTTPPKDFPPALPPPPAKGALRSKTIIGALLTLVGAFGLFGMSFDASTMTLSIRVDNFLEALMGAAIPGGALLSWFGRKAATTAIKGLW